MNTKIFGALLSKIDVRDYQISPTQEINLPKEYKLCYLPKIKNQKNVLSCVAHAMSTILEYFNYQETQNIEQLSTNFIYGMQGIEFNRKASGMYLRDACKIVKKYGDAKESSVKGNTEQPECTFQLQQQLTQEIYNEALQFKIKSYAQCKTEKSIKYALVNHGPILASIKWYNNYEIKNEIINFNTKSDYGYHAIVIYGWNEKGWLCQNSWGNNWNQNGRFIYSYQDKFAEAWSFIDVIGEENIIIPKNNIFLNWIYKIFNNILNLFRKER